MFHCSGAIYQIFFTAAAQAFPPTIPQALKCGVAAVQKYGGASQGNRTLLDTLIPLQQFLENAQEQGKLDDAATLSQA